MCEVFKYTSRSKPKNIKLLQQVVWHPEENNQGRDALRGETFLGYQDMLLSLSIKTWEMPVKYNKHILVTLACWYVWVPDMGALWHVPSVNTHVEYTWVPCVCFSYSWHVNITCKWQCSHFCTRTLHFCFCVIWNVTNYPVGINMCILCVFLWSLAHWWPSLPNTDYFPIFNHLKRSMCFPLSLPEMWRWIHFEWVLAGPCSWKPLSFQKMSNPIFGFCHCVLQLLW